MEYLKSYEEFEIFFTYISIVHDDLMSLLRNQWRMFTIPRVDIFVQIRHHICENMQHWLAK